jgi:hypothetical protein
MKPPDTVECVPTETANKVLDRMDEEIKKQQSDHLQRMALLDQEISDERRKRGQWKQFRKDNAVVRDKIQNELTEDVIKEMFEINRSYLEAVWNGNIESKRHQAFNGGIKSRQQLLYKTISNLFTDEHVNWVVEELSKIGMDV